MFDRNGGIFGNFQMFFGFGMVVFLIVKFPNNIICLVQGGFQLLALIITELKCHMTC